MRGRRSDAGFLGSRNVARAPPPLTNLLLQVPGRILARRPFMTTHSQDGPSARADRQREADAFFHRELDPPAVVRVKAERAMHDAEADAFFAASWSTERLSRLLDEYGTPQVLLDAFSRDCERARIAHADATRGDVLAELAEGRRAARVRREALAERRRAETERVRAWAAANPERVRANRRRWADNNRERRKQINREYYQRNRDAILAKQRERNHVDPARRAEYNRRYAQAHPERKTAFNKAWRSDPENNKRHQEATKRWNDRERRRRELGMPARRIHKDPPETIRASQRDADAFFQRSWPAAEIRRIRREHGEPTPPDLLAAWKADCASARLRFRLADDPEFRERVEARQATRAHERLERERVEQEAARMDSIARAINDRLRGRPRRRSNAATVDRWTPTQPPLDPEPGGIGL
ncbi:hypothetical protein GCM10023087_07870 [Microbacterium rhizosphaerae]